MGFVVSNYRLMASSMRLCIAVFLKHFRIFNEYSSSKSWLAVTRKWGEHLKTAAASSSSGSLSSKPLSFTSSSNFQKKFILFVKWSFYQPRYHPFPSDFSNYHAHRRTTFSLNAWDWAAWGCSRFLDKSIQSSWFYGKGGFWVNLEARQACLCSPATCW